MSSSSSSFGHGWTYDVFLSFRGDTRKNFTDHLYTSLKQSGIHTFRDNEELPKGDEISQNLRDAIRKSRISIVVFSKDYASSRWCLDELVEILECKHRMESYTVLPIFYDIDPSDIRKQTGSYAEAFDKHEVRFREETEKVDKWRAALTEAGNLSGWGLKDEANGYESEFIHQIIEDVSNKLDRKHLYVAKYPVGIDYRLEHIIARLSIDTEGVRIVGIHGMGGIGKTTLAKAVFNQLCGRFMESCFLSNVKENGLVQLQEQLLHDTLKRQIPKISNEDRGISLIRERLCHKRVLIVVDDVDQLKQLDALVGERSWFGCGSRIIITTRDERLLTQFDVDEKYHARELSQDESFQLFSCHAFKFTEPKKDYEELSIAVVDYSRGLPLALEVLGGSLYKRSKLEWKSVIEKLRKIPPQDIQKKLRLSFDTLEDDELKEIFLDIACFFVGWDEEYVEIILDARGFSPVIGIRRLIERSLLIKDHKNKLVMHDVVRAMGREIIRSLNKLGSRSRIWFGEDALDVLKKNMGTEIIEGLTLDARAAEGISLSTESFTNMRHLKLLQINGVNLTGRFENLSKELIWLCWLECPLKSFPSNFHLDKITILDLQHSNLKELWKETKHLNKLKILDISHSKCLAKTPNFIGLTSLKRLMLEDCMSLVEVHQSIGYLQRLVSLNLKGCCGLKNLPQSFCNLKSLETLDITMCSRLENLPEHFGELESLSKLLAGGTAITQLPSSIGNLKSLTILVLHACDYNRGSQSTSWLSSFATWFSPINSSNSKAAFLPTSFIGLTSLTGLDLSFCGLNESSISNFAIGRLTGLTELNLSGNFFDNLPCGINHLKKLVNIEVDECPNLESVSEVLSTALSAQNCKSLERVSIQPGRMKGVWVNGCQNLKEIQGAVEDDVLYIHSLDCNNLSKNFQNSRLQALCKRGFGRYEILLAGGDIPKWFSHQGEGSSISFKVPPASDGILQALVVWVVYSTDDVLEYPGPVGGRVAIENKSNGNLFSTSRIHFPWVKASSSVVSSITFPPRAMEGVEELEISVEIGDYKHVDIKKCGVHLIMKEPVDHEMLNVDGQGTTPSSTNDEGGWVSCFVSELQERQISYTIAYDY